MEILFGEKFLPLQRNCSKRKRECGEIVDHSIK